MTRTLRALDLRDLLVDARQVARSHHVTLDEMWGRSRMAPVVEARVAFWRLLRGRGWSYPAIARLAGRDHSTVMKCLQRRGQGT